MRALRLLATILLIVAVTAAAQAVTVSKSLAVLFTGSNQVIASISLSNNSFTGGAGSGTTVGTVTVTMSPPSPAFSGTLSLTGTQRGSGNDGNSFQFSGSTLQTNTSGGTDQAGTYSINIVATQPGLQPLSQPETISASGTGGAGVQLGFSDEFLCQSGMLNCLVSYPITSMTWSATNGGQIAVVLPSSSTVAQIGQGASVSGATNGGSGGNGLVNGNFSVNTVTDSQHFTIYAPATSGQVSGISVGSAVLGLGPWMPTIAESCSGTPGPPCSGLPRLYGNNGPEGWDSHDNCIVSGGYLQIIGAEPAGGWTAPDGTTHTYTACHIGADDPGLGFSQQYGIFEWYGQVAPGPGIHDTGWSCCSIEYWPYGGEIDNGEFIVGPSSVTPANPTQPRLNTINASAENSFSYTTATNFSLANHDFQANWSNTQVAFTVDGTLVTTSSSDVPTTSAQYPIVDMEIDDPSTGSAAGNTFPVTYFLKFFRVYVPVSSHACYAAPVATSVVPHTGTC
jgi:hypothetical protein